MRGAGCANEGACVPVCGPVKGVPSGCGCAREQGSATVRRCDGAGMQESGRVHACKSGHESVNR